MFSCYPMLFDSSTETARALVRGASAVVVLTGAGISTDSGIPDFRGPQGVWTKNPAAEKMATLQNYLADPEVRVRAWQSRLEGAARQTAPNDGHRALVALEGRGALHTLVTQNVDGLHQAAGTHPRLVVEIHGTSRRAMCWTCRREWPMEPFLDRVRLGEADPDCPDCGGIVKSATISFGQNLVEDDLERAFTAAAECDLLIAIGTTLSVYPIARMVPIAVAARSPVIILNAEATEMDQLGTHVLRGSISEILPFLVS